MSFSMCWPSGHTLRCSVGTEPLGRDNGVTIGGRVAVTGVDGSAGGAPVGGTAWREVVSSTVLAAISFAGGVYPVSSS
jgi:hypothetical protein